MSIIIPDRLPARETLIKENIFVMNESEAVTQDIRALRIVILNLMPNKQETELQLLRMIGNTPLQIDVRLLHMESHTSKNTPAEHLVAFYNVFGDVKGERFDGMVMTGAPVELLKFEDVNYWDELRGIMDWTRTNVYSTFHICWGAQAGLYHHYGIPKYPLDRKVSGVFEHRASVGPESANKKLLIGFDDAFFAPHSRHSEVRRADLEKVGELEILAESDEAGVYIAASRDGRMIFVTGHSEYERDRLKIEYERDAAKGMNPDVPANYFQGGDPNRPPVVRWRAHAHLLYTNWLNYYVYQETPYDLDEL